MRVRDVADRLYEEAARVSTRALAAQDQGDGDFAVVLSQVEFGLVLVAHVFEAVHDDLEEEGVE